MVRSLIWLRRPVVLALLVAVVAALVFSPSAGGGWIYDDHHLIADNPFSHALHWWPRWFVTDFWNVTGDEGPSAPRLVYWRPLVTATYAMDWRGSGGQPWLFHVTNLVMHAAVGGLAFVVLRRWIGAVVPAFAAALLFAVHSTKAESVAWISGRTDVLCMLAVLVATIGIARRLRGQRGGLALEVFGTIAAYTTKEQAIVLPVFAAIEIWVLADRPPLDRQVITRAIRGALPQTAIAIAYLVLRRLLMPLRSDNFEGGIGLSDHVQSILESFGRFIALTVAPHDLSTQHGLIQVAGGEIVHSTPYVVFGAVALAALVTAAVLARRRAPFVAIGLAFYLVTLLPTSNIIYAHLETLVSERFLYLPTFGIAFVVGGTIASRPLRSSYALLAAVVIAMAALSLGHAADYQDEQRFWAREYALHPESPTARREQIKTAIAEKRYRSAVVLLLELTRNQVSYEDVAVAFQLVQLLSDLTPDHDRAGLAALDAFCRDLVASKQPAVTLDTAGVSFTIPTDGKSFPKAIRNYRLRFLGHRAILRTRLGDDQAALALAAEARTACPTCSDVTALVAMVDARAGLYDEAVSVLDHAPGEVPDPELERLSVLIDKARAAHMRSLSAAGPAQVQASVAELSALQLWGRAYDVLAPHKDEVRQAPRAIPGFAEIAFRAGEPAVARELLATIVSPREVDQRFAEWAHTMGWSE